MSLLYFVLYTNQFSKYFSQYVPLLSLTFSLERKRSASESQYFLVKLGCHDIKKFK